jgi:hypothetical protein
MTDPTLSTLALIGLVFGGVAAASLLVRAVLIVGGVIRELTSAGEGRPLPRSFEPLRAA